MLEDDVRHLLSVAADDGDAPALVSPLMSFERARARHVRHRQAMAAGVIGCLCTGAALVLGLTQHGNDSPPTRLVKGQPITLTHTVTNTATATSTTTAGASMPGGIPVQEGTTVHVDNPALTVTTIRTEQVLRTVHGSPITTSIVVTGIAPPPVTRTATETATVSQTVRSTVTSTVFRTRTVTTTVLVTVTPTGPSQGAG